MRLRSELAGPASPQGSFIHAQQPRPILAEAQAAMHGTGARTRRTVDEGPAAWRVCIIEGKRARREGRGARVRADTAVHTAGPRLSMCA